MAQCELLIYYMQLFCAADLELGRLYSPEHLCAPGNSNKAPHGVKGKKNSSAPPKKGYKINLTAAHLNASELWECQAEQTDALSAHCSALQPSAGFQGCPGGRNACLKKTEVPQDLEQAHGASARASPAVSLIWPIYGLQESRSLKTNLLSRLLNFPSLITAFVCSQMSGTTARSYKPWETARGFPSWTWMKHSRQIDANPTAGFVLVRASGRLEETQAPHIFLPVRPPTLEAMEHFMPTLLT